jgi:hypothetical protein
MNKTLPYYISECANRHNPQLLTAASQTASTTIVTVPKDGDGTLEVVVTTSDNSGAANRIIALKDESGETPPVSAMWVYTASLYTSPWGVDQYSAALADADGDGLLDVLLTYAVMAKSMPTMAHTETEECSSSLGAHHRHGLARRPGRRRQPKSSSPASTATYGRWRQVTGYSCRWRCVERLTRDLQDASGIPAAFSNGTCFSRKLQRQ